TSAARTPRCAMRPRRSSLPARTLAPNCVRRCVPPMPRCAGGRGASSTGWGTLAPGRRYSTPSSLASGTAPSTRSRKGAAGWRGGDQEVAGGRAVLEGAGILIRREQQRHGLTDLSRRWLFRPGAIARLRAGYRAEACPPQISQAPLLCADYGYGLVRGNA